MKGKRIESQFYWNQTLLAKHLQDNSIYGNGLSLSLQYHAGLDILMILSPVPSTSIVQD